jgi:hypothetical protein
MTATYEQLVAEAERRWKLAGCNSKHYPYFIIEVTREGWTPPEPPVDPDVLAYWDWHKSVNPTGRLILNVCDAYLAGARMAREQEQERQANQFAKQRPRSAQGG